MPAASVVNSLTTRNANLASGGRREPKQHHRCRTGGIRFPAAVHFL